MSRGKGKPYLSPVAVDSLAYIYYGGFDSGHNSEPVGWNGSVGLAVIKRDRYMSARAGDEPGEVITRPVYPSGKTLRLNYRTEPGGWIKTGLLKPDGGVISGFGTGDAEPLSGDHTERTASWGGRIKLPDSAAWLRLRFVMKRARLYSFGFDD